MAGGVVVIVVAVVGLWREWACWSEEVEGDERSDVDGDLVDGG